MLCIVLTVLIVSVISKEITSDLQMVHVFFRHGVRYPEEIEVFPNDPYYHLFSKVHGQLTKKGKRDSYALGQFLRDRYDKLIKNIYDNNDNIHVISTARNRTIMTAQFVLGGIFQDSLKELLAEHDWKRMPYKIEQKELDIDLSASSQHFNCRAYNDEVHRVVTSSDYINLSEKYKDLFKYLSEQTGNTIDSVVEVLRLYEGLSAEESLNLHLPNWARTVYPQILQDAGANAFNILNYSSLLKRLNGGKLLRLIIDNTIDYINSAFHRKIPRMYLLSGHDRTVVSILAAIDAYSPHVPQYNSAIIVELHQSRITKQYFIKVFYLKGVDLKMEQLHIKGCTGKCRFEDFLKCVQPHTLVNFEKECNN